jgi:cytochrome c550
MDFKKIILRSDIMKGKPLFPYLGIAVVALVLMIGLSFIGVNQKDAKIALEGEDPAQEQTAETSTPASLGEETYKTSCIGCHGGNFDGPVGNLQDIGDRRSKDEIITIINEGGADFGLPGMAAYPDVDAEAIADYLLEATK